ncbi:hypothetical protein RugamoR57_00050 [Duganella caerulea]
MYGGEKDHDGFLPEDALKMAVYYAAHPREITLEHIQQHTSRKLLLSDCAEYGSLRQCSYSPEDVGADAAGLQSVTVSSTTSGVPRGGFILWRFSEVPCISSETVAQFVGNTSVAPVLPPTFYQPPGTPGPTSPSPEYRTYESKTWDPAARVQTVTMDCLEMISLNAQLPKE